jgi:hypothetical protein
MADGMMMMMMMMMCVCVSVPHVLQAFCTKILEEGPYQGLDHEVIIRGLAYYILALEYKSDEALAKQVIAWTSGGGSSPFNTCLARSPFTPPASFEPLWALICRGATGAAMCHARPLPSNIITSRPPIDDLTAMHRRTRPVVRRPSPRCRMCSRPSSGTRCRRSSRRRPSTAGDSGTCCAGSSTRWGGGLTWFHIDRSIGRIVDRHDRETYHRAGGGSHRLRGLQEPPARGRRPGGKGATTGGSWPPRRENGSTIRDLTSVSIVSR